MHYVELSCRDSWYWCGLANAIGRFGAMVGPAVAGALVTAGLPVTVIFPVTAVGYLLVGILFFFYNDKLSKQA